MDIAEMKTAVNDARTTLTRVAHVANDMLDILNSTHLYRADVPKVVSMAAKVDLTLANHHDLVAIKRKLRDFNIHTGMWKKGA